VLPFFVADTTAGELRGNSSHNDPRSSET